MLIGKYIHFETKNLVSSQRQQTGDVLIMLFLSQIQAWLREACKRPCWSETKLKYFDFLVEFSPPRPDNFTANNEVS